MSAAELSTFLRGLFTVEPVGGGERAIVVLKIDGFAFAVGDLRDARDARAVREFVVESLAARLTPSTEASRGS